VWKLAVSSPSGPVPKRQLDLEATFSYVLEDTTTARGAAHASAELLPPAAPNPAAVASIRIGAALSTLRSGESGTLFVIVSSKSADPIRIRRLSAHGPDFVEFTGLEGGQRIAPGDVAILKVGVTAQNRVRAGPNQLVVKIPVEVGGERVTLAAEKVVKIGVTGESAVLTALGVPALFLIPGFLVVATASLLWRLRLLRRRWDAADFPFEARSAEFWVLAISVSIPMAALWAALGTDLFDTYGLEDILWVWVASVILGTLVYVAWMLVRNRRQEGRTPSPEDGPLETLEKLQRQGLGLTRERYEYLTGSEAKVLYLLQPADEARPATWLAPPIDFEWTSTNGTLGRRIEDAFRADNPGSLAAALRAGSRAGSVDVRWSGDAEPIDRPTLVDADKIGSARGADAIVHEAE
jgi:hypothetical protein